MANGIGMIAYVVLRVADLSHLVCHCFLMCLHGHNLLHDVKVMEPFTILLSSRSASMSACHGLYQGPKNVLCRASECASMHSTILSH